jgi:hypothetical protein
LFKTAHEVKRELAGLSDISLRRIQEVLQKKLKMSSRTAAKKPLLMAQVTRKRIFFAKSTLTGPPSSGRT